MKAALRTFLSESAAIADLVDDRVFWLHADQADDQDAAPQLPRIIFQTISRTTGQTMENADDFHEARVQINADAAIDTEADALAAAVINRMNGYRGEWEDVEIHGVELITDVDQYFPPITGESTPIYRVAIDFRIAYRRPKPDHT